MRKKHFIILGGLLIAVGSGLLAFTLLRPQADHDHHTHMDPQVASAVTELCEKTGKVVPLSIEHGKFSPNTLELHRCDQLDIANNDDQAHIPAFGGHDKHTDYPGFDEIVIKPGEHELITMAKSGSYTMHSHYQRR